MASTIQVDNIKDIGGNTIISSNGSGTFTSNLPNDGKLLISAQDTTANYLQSKIVQGSGMNITLNGAGSNESITFAATATNTPAFQAFMPAASSVPNTTYTKIPCSTELYDTDSTYNNSTYVFTPGVVGKYFIYAQTKPDSSTDFNDSIIKIKKNGSDIIFYARRNTNSDSVSCSGVVTANATDYFHAEYYQASGGAINIQGGSSGTKTYFGAYKVIGA